MLVILLMGFASGLPLLLTLSTLSWWLATMDISKAQIGLFALVGLPYTLKFVWAPLTDGIAPPIFRGRRGWLLTFQLGLIGSVIALGYSDPSQNLVWTATAALLVAFFSASQDIAVDAYRIELLPKKDQALGAAVTQFGYRFGLLYSGAGALFLSDIFSWEKVFLFMAAGILVGLITTLFAPDATKARLGSKSLTQMAVVPFLSFMDRRHWLLLIIFICVYKLGDAALGVMANPFYYEMGFSASQIAFASKTFGVGCTMLGIAVGGIYATRRGIVPALLVVGVFQLVSNLFFAIQALLGDNFAFLLVTIAVENVSGGMGGAVFVAFLSRLARKPWIAAQYALLTSLMALARVVLSAPSGFVAEQFSWAVYFCFTALAALPGVLMVVVYKRSLKVEC